MQYDELIEQQEMAWEQHALIEQIHSLSEQVKSLRKKSEKKSAGQSGHPSYVGRTEGNYSVRMFSVNGAATLENIEGIRDLRDDLALDPLAGRIGFRTQATNKSFQGKVIARAADGNGRVTEVSTKSFKGGRDQVWFSSTGDALLYYHSGEQTTSVIQLSAAGRTVFPSTLELPPMQVDDGDRVAVAPESWSQLEARGVRIRI